MSNRSGSISEGRGRRRFESERATREQIRDLLPTDGSEISYSELKVKASELGTGRRTLDRWLARELKAEKIVRRVDTSYHPTRSYYRMRVPKPMQKWRSQLEPGEIVVEDLTRKLPKRLPRGKAELKNGLLLKSLSSTVMVDIFSAWLTSLKARSGKEAWRILDDVCRRFIVPQIRNIGTLARARPSTFEPNLRREFDRLSIEARTSSRELTRLMKELKRSPRSRPTLRGGGERA